MVVGQALDGRDGASLDVFDSDRTGTLGFAVNENRAHAAFGDAAGVFHARDPQVVPQNLQQRRLRVGIDLLGHTVHHECKHAASSCCCLLFG